MEKISRLNALIEVLKSTPFRVNKIWVQSGSEKRKIGEIVKLAKAQDIPILFVPKRRLDRVDNHHQGAIAFFSPKEVSSLESIITSSKHPFLILLDGIEDPQNLGAIIRTAEGAGVDGILLPERRSAGLTETVYKVSTGALEHIKVARIKNLVRTMEDLKKRGIWLVGAEGGSQDLWYDFDYRVPLGLVLGSEGSGLRPLVKRKCDRVLSIPLMGKITSLNVASAAAIFIYEVVRQRMDKLE